MDTATVMETARRGIDVLNALLPGGLWTAWCLWAIDWRKAWPVLAAGGWVVLALVAVTAAYAWSLVDPRPLVIGDRQVANWTWKLAAAAALTGVALLCGWLQSRSGWAPAEVSLEPPAGGHHDDHHGHH